MNYNGQKTLIEGVIYRDVVAANLDPTTTRRRVVQRGQPRPGPYTCDRATHAVPRGSHRARRAHRRRWQCATIAARRHVAAARIRP